MIKSEVFMDIHSHIIPGVDDGSSSMEESIAMLKQAYEEGIRVIIATPHYGARNPDYDGYKAKAIFKKLKESADEHFPGLKMFMGNELYYSQGTLDSLQKGWAKTIGGTDYVLVEFSTRDSYDKIAGAVQELTWGGYRPIIAHIERYECLVDDVDRVRTLVEQGACVQVNCRSIIKNKSRKERKKAFYLEQKKEWTEKLLREELVHFIASDCHDSKQRSPVYSSVVQEMREQYGDQLTNKIVNSNIVKLIRNEAI